MDTFSDKRKRGYAAIRNFVTSGTIMVIPPSRSRSTSQPWLTLVLTHQPWPTLGIDQTFLPPRLSILSPHKRSKLIPLMRRTKQVRLLSTLRNLVHFPPKSDSSSDVKYQLNPLRTVSSSRLVTLFKPFSNYTIPVT